MTTKADQIRSVVNEKYIQTNNEIIQLVQQKYGVRVGQNEVINVLGSFNERSKNKTYDERVLNSGRRFLQLAGDITNARRVITYLDLER